MEIIRYDAEWENELADIERMGRGLLAVKFAVYEAVGHILFNVRRMKALKGKQYRHNYFVECDDKKWCLIKYDNNQVVWCGGTIQPSMSMAIK